MESKDHLFCLDPSCFTSLTKLIDTKNVLDELKSENQAFRICIPTDVYSTIMLDPSEKFRQLPNVIEEWLDEKEKENIKNISFSDSKKYVLVMRELLDRYKPLPISEFNVNVENIGKESIYRNDIINKFNKAGKILFEILAVSSERNSVIVSFGEKTVAMIKKIGSVIKKGHSAVKGRVKKVRGIGGALVFIHFFIDMEKVNQFLQDFQIDGFPLTLTETITLGLLIIGNG